MLLSETPEEQGRKFCGLLFRLNKVPLDTITLNPAPAITHCHSAVVFIGFERRRNHSAELIFTFKENQETVMGNEDEVRANH